MTDYPLPNMQVLASALPASSSWDVLVAGDLYSLCRQEFQAALTATYARHRWVYDALLEHRDAVLLRGRRPVVSGVLGGVRVVVKRIYHGGVLACIGRDAFLTSRRARLQVELAEYLSQRGIATAPVVFTSWRRTRGFVRCEAGFEEIPGGIDADQYFFGRSTLPESWESHASEIGTLVARLHQIGFLHADLNLMNFLFGRDGRTYILDLDKTNLPKRSLSNRQRDRNLDRLERSIRKQGRTHLASVVEGIIRRIRFSYRNAL